MFIDMLFYSSSLDEYSARHYVPLTFKISIFNPTGRGRNRLSQAMLFVLYSRLNKCNLLQRSRALCYFMDLSKSTDTNLTIINSKPARAYNLIPSLINSSFYLTILG